MSKKLIPIQIKLRVWDGTLDHSWYTNSVDGIAHISTPEQFADFITPTSSRSGITEVHLDNDLYFNENYLENKTWTVDTQNNSIINTAVQSSRQLFTLTNDLTFYGHLHSIYGFSWKATANSENQFIFLEGQTRNLTFKDLYLRNCYFTEAAGSGFILGVDNNSTYGCHFQNVEFIDTYFDYRGAKSWGVWNTSIFTRTSRSSIVFNGCQFRNVTCIAQKGGQNGTFSNDYEFNIILKDCTSTTTNFNQIFYNGQTTKQLAYSYGNTSIVNNKTSYEELIDSFNSYESSTMELVDVEEDFTFENTPEPTDEHYEEPFVKPLSIPEGSDFLWRAMDYDTSTKNIPNMVEGSGFGTYNANGTPTKNGRGKDCYISGDYNNYLCYDNLSSTQMSNFYANSNSDSYYTYIFKVYNTSGVGGIVSFRSNANVYNYMIRSNGNNFQVHDTSGHDVCSLIDGHICKVEINYDKAYWYDLTDGRSGSITIGTTRNMGTTMFSIQSEIGATREASLSKWYGLYGIPRKLTDEETQDVIRMLDGEDPHDDRPINYRKRTKVDEPKFNVWDGVTYDGSWWDESSSILNIDTAAQVADFFRNSNGHKLDGKTINFNNNFYMNLNYKDCHKWTDTSNDFYWIKPNNHSVIADNNNTETIIDGKCHTIYGLAICDYSTSERHAIMDLNNIATIKDLRFDGLWSWERKSYGRLFKFYYGRAKIYNVVLCNSNIVDHGFSSYYKASIVNFGDYSKGNNEVNMVLYNNKLKLTTSPGFMGRAVYGTNVKYNVCAYSNIAVNTGILFPVSQLTVDSGSNYEYYDMSGFTNSGISCDSVESLIESYNSNHVFSDERELYIDENNNPTFWDESHEQILPSDYVYEDEKVGQVINILKDQTFPYTQQADYRDMYTWALWGHKVNSSTTGIEWTIAKPCTITFECWQSSEANYDYGHIDKNGSEIKSWRGQGSTHSTYEASFVAGDKLRLRYTKNGSVSSGDDTFYCKMMIDGFGIDEHGDCFVGTTVRHWYKLGEKKLLLINKKDIGE